MASIRSASRGFLCECPMTSLRALLSRRWTGHIGISIGQRAARTIERIIRPRGCKSGIRHKPVKPIETIISKYRAAPVLSDRNSVLTKIPAISSCLEKLKFSGALWNARSLNGKISQLGCALIENQLDIVIITETWIKCKDDPIISELYLQ